MRRILAVVAILGGCAVQPPAPVTDPRPAPVPAPAPEAAPAPVPAPEPDTGSAALPALPEAAPTPLPGPTAAAGSAAVASLVNTARTDAAAGRLANAAASLERALRIEPRNPRLWQELARVRMQQGDYAQAESTAARSNSWAGNDGRLRAENWRLIAQAREARGDAAGARAALDTAERQR